MSINPVGDGFDSVYFGRYWDVPAMENARLMPTPVGTLCGGCDIAIVEGDQGLLMRTIGMVDGSPQASWMVLHRECQLRMVIGSVEHMEGRCTCRGGEPPTETLRESALALRKWLVERGCW